MNFFNKHILSIRNMIAIISASLFITGCDFSLNLTSEGAVKDATIERLVRGMADSLGVVGENPEKTDNRRELFVKGIGEFGVNVDKKFFDALNDNKKYLNVKFFTEDVLTVTSFEMENGILVNIYFVIEQKSIIGPMRISKNPMIAKIDILKNGDPLLVYNEGYDSMGLANIAQDIFIKIINNDKQLFQSFVLNLIKKKEKKDEDKKRMEEEKERKRKIEQRKIDCSNKSQELMSSYIKNPDISKINNKVEFFENLRKEEEKCNQE